MKAITMTFETKIYSEMQPLLQTLKTQSPKLYTQLVAYSHNLDLPSDENLMHECISRLSALARQCPKLFNVIRNEMQA